LTENLRILDTTLRDGDQSAGFAFTPEQKLRLAFLLDACGVDCIEAGFPCSSPADYAACRKIVKADIKADIAVMSRCIAADIMKTAELFSDINDSSRAVLHITVPVSDIQIRTKLHKPVNEIISLIRDSVTLAVSLVHKVEIGFEDATRAEYPFLAACCHAAVASGASVINIADTTGSLLPEEMSGIVHFLIREIPSFSTDSVLLSIHCHNDCGLALACTLAAVKAGASQVEVTAGGLGERCGNTPLEELSYVLSSHRDFSTVAVKLKPEYFADLFRTLFTCCGTDFSPLKPVTGWNIDSHASGLHQQGISLDPFSYIASPVQSYGLVHRRIILSRHSGKAGLLAAVNNLSGGTIRLTDYEAGILLSEIKVSEKNETGITDLCILLYNHKIISDEPVIPRAVSLRYENNLFTVHVSTSQKAGEGTGPTLESAILDAVNKISADSVSITTLSVSRYFAYNSGEAQTRIYAEITEGTEKNPYTVSACSRTEADALFCCLLDVINGIRLRNKKETA